VSMVRSLKSLKVTLSRVVRGSALASEAEEKKSWKGFASRIPKAIVVIGVVMVVVAGMEHLGWFRGFETSHLDTLIRLRSGEMSKKIVIVEISEEDYQRRFDGTSPLDKWKLLGLLRAVQKYNPRVIGVDIDTNDWHAACRRGQGGAQCAQQCAEFDKALGELRAAAEPNPEAGNSGTTIVWAAVPRTLDPPLELNPGLGSLPLGWDWQGIPRFPVDEDGSVRHFDGRVEVKKSGDECPRGADKVGEACYLPTFARAIVEAFRHKPRITADEQVVFNFHGDRYQFPIIDAKQFFPEQVANEKRSKEEIASENEAIEQSRVGQFADKVVLIGGGFPEARDEYFTPRGSMQGVELNALAIQTDLDGGGIHDFTRGCELLIDFAVSLLIVGMFYLYEQRPWKAVGMSFLVVPAAFVSSLVLFNSLAYWFNFIPVAAGVFIHQLYELAEGGSEAREKLRELQHEQEPVGVDVATVEEVTVAENAQAGATEETLSVENAKAKRAASGAD
jgi:CHASE2 domain-containing sensor protein